jgi:hypothetical protein
MLVVISSRSELTADGALVSHVILSGVSGWTDRSCTMWQGLTLEAARWLSRARRQVEVREMSLHRILHRVRAQVVAHLGCVATVGLHHAHVRIKAGIRLSRNLRNRSPACERRTTIRASRKSLRFGFEDAARLLIVACAILLGHCRQLQIRLTGSVRVRRCGDLQYRRRV